MKTPFFSIIIPVYKVRQDFFKKCIDSILTQSFKDFELIIVEDGSPDDCGQICDEYAAADSRICVIHQPNQGVSVARNNGIKKASAPWIIFIDGDDWIGPDSLKILHSHLQDKSCDMLMFKALRVTGENCFPIECGLEHKGLYELTDPFDREYLYRRVMGVSVGQKYFSPVYYIWNKVYNRAFLIENKIEYPVGLAKSEDKVFICRCFQKATRIYHVNDTLYNYRMNAESVCHRYSSNIDQVRKQLSEELVPIAEEMDRELAAVLDNPSYHKISDDCTRFIFGSITDVLYLKYYHHNNPDRRTRRKDALKFLRSEPFKSAIDKIPYSSLSKASKMKKFMLKHGLVSSFCRMSMKIRKI